MPTAAPKATAPVWAGPAGNGPQGGVTQSLLGRYLSDGERFRLKVMGGWTTTDRFDPKREFGNLWHACEEALASERNHFGEVVGTTLWEDNLRTYMEGMLTRYPLDREAVVHWAGLAGALFPQYVRHWAKHPDVLNRTPLLQEQAFDVPYRLPSGRVVRLRGKWDAVDLIDGAVWVQENKTKSTIDGVKIGRQCSFDLQSMFYLVALSEKPSCDLPRTGHYRHGGGTGRGNVVMGGGAPPGEYPIAGVRYNVVRRPAHKTVESAMKKFGEDSRNGRIGEWFARWQVTVGPEDVARFRRVCLDPILENLLDDYEWWEDRYTYLARCTGPTGARADQFSHEVRHHKFPHHARRHFRTPYFYNPIAEGGAGDLDALMDQGSQAGLVRATDLFPELKETR